MTEFNRQEYQTVILRALLHVHRSRPVGGYGKGGVEWNLD